MIKFDLKLPHARYKWIRESRQRSVDVMLHNKVNNNNKIQGAQKNTAEDKRHHKLL